MDVKEPGCPSKSLGVQKQKDGAGMHKRPENGMWLTTGRQLETVTWVKLLPSWLGNPSFEKFGTRNFRICEILSKKKKLF